MRGKVRIMAIDAATLLASPAFAGWPLTQAAQTEPIDSQRVITEAVINGRLIEAGLDEAPASELRAATSPLDESLGPHVNIHGEEDVTCSSRSFGQHTSLSPS
jgi:hypothetical protein